MSFKNLTLLFLTVLLVNVLPTLAATNKDFTIIETPWLVLISKDTNNQKNNMISKKTCPGALINPQAVLTTVTCLDLNLEETKNLIVEAYNQSRQVSQVNLREFNPQYFLHNNYALLKLSEPFLLSSNLNTIILASVNEYLDILKCQQLTHYDTSSDNTSISRVMGKISFSNNSYCYRDMSQLHISYQKPSISWHPSILCSTHFNILPCIKLQDWSAMVICPRSNDPNIFVLVGFQLTFLVFDSKPAENKLTIGDDDCIIVYSNMFQASPWIKEQIDDFNDDEVSIENENIY
ncbi:uncharacterized protein [Chelonus insularis]|uniref:uncharacterized protein n=1 Tax=Chelonus insularis TaxID=460826 RepID=UPI00158C18C8|nr:uncharacterized protein LOC118074432 [Chelonus insularis]